MILKDLRIDLLIQFNQSYHFPKECDAIARLYFRHREHQTIDFFVIEDLVSVAKSPERNYSSRREGRLSRRNGTSSLIVGENLLLMVPLSFYFLNTHVTGLFGTGDSVMDTDRHELKSFIWSWRCN